MYLKTDFFEMGNYCYEGTSYDLLSLCTFKMRIIWIIYENKMNHFLLCCVFNAFLFEVPWSILTRTTPKVFVYFVFSKWNIVKRKWVY